MIFASAGQLHVSRKIKRRWSRLRGVHTQIRSDQTLKAQDWSIFSIRHHGSQLEIVIMKTQKICVLIENKKVEITVRYDAAKCLMKLSESETPQRIYGGRDLYVCLAKIRADHPRIAFLCKGARLNVMPSRMASQMSAGLVAYQMTMGKPALPEDIVHIFDYEEENLTNDPQEQITFFKTWLASLSAERYEDFN